MEININYTQKPLIIKQRYHIRQRCLQKSFKVWISLQGNSNSGLSACDFSCSGVFCNGDAHDDGNV